MQPFVLRPTVHESSVNVMSHQTLSLLMLNFPTPIYPGARDGPALKMAAGTNSPSRGTCRWVEWETKERNQDLVEEEKSSTGRA